MSHVLHFLHLGQDQGYRIDHANDTHIVPREQVYIDASHLYHKIDVARVGGQNMNSKQSIQLENCRWVYRIVGGLDVAVLKQQVSSIQWGKGDPQAPPHADYIPSCCK